MDKFFPLLESVLLEFDLGRTINALGGEEKFYNRISDDTSVVNDDVLDITSVLPPNDDPELKYELSDLYPSLLKRLREIDPTQNLSYSRWIIQTYLSGGIRYWEDMTRTRNALRKFDEFKKRRIFTGTEAKFANIFNFKKLNDLEGVLSRLELVHGSQSKRAEDAELEAQAKRDSDIDKFPGCTVIHPKTERAACFWGRGTKWCTATEDPEDSSFHQYDDEGPLHIFIPTSPVHIGEKYQIHVPKSESDIDEISLMDEDDDVVQLEYLLNDKRFHTALTKVLSISEADSDFIVLWKEILGQRLNIILKLSQNYDGMFSRDFPALATAKFGDWYLNADNFVLFADLFTKDRSLESGFIVNDKAWDLLNKEIASGKRTLANSDSQNIFSIDPDSNLFDLIKETYKHSLNGGEPKYFYRDVALSDNSTVEIQGRGSSFISIGQISKMFGLDDVKWEIEQLIRLKFGVTIGFLDQLRHFDGTHRFQILGWVRASILIKKPASDGKYYFSPFEIELGYVAESMLPKNLWSCLEPEKIFAAYKKAKVRPLKPGETYSYD